jgi:uncharacterized protein YecT (DUF1311 family)
MKIFIFAVFTSFVIPAFAVTADDCDGIISNNLRFNCYGDLLKQEDLRLNEAYKEVKRVAMAPLFAKIQIAQRAWIQYRDTDCGARKSMIETVLGPDNSSVVCLALKTKTRADELTDYAEFLNQNTEGNESE